MYKNDVVFDFFCAGLESRNFKHTTTVMCSTISDLITPSHEAHFRLELWFSLPYLEFRHGIGKQHAKLRIAKWREFMPLVLQDRKNNESDAFAKRSAVYQEGGHKVAEKPSGEGGLDESDAKYWA